MTLPDPAELARTSLAQARVAALTTYPRSAPARPRLTSVTMACQDDGRPVIRVGAGSRAAVDLLARPLATVRVSPVGGETVTVHGGAQRLPGRDECGRLAFRVEVGAVRLGVVRHATVDLHAFDAAEPDPLRDDAPRVLAHLREAHTDQLTACVRAVGHDAQWAQATALDRYGMTVLAVSGDGVDEVRLSFPEPVRRLQDLRPGLGCLLMCRCGCAAST